MSGLSQTPSGERRHISIFGRRNAGKSSLINALTGQALAIVSDVPGTTTDPVSKAMELLPLGPVVLTDTAGLDDEGPLGEARVRRSLRVLEKTDLALLVVEDGQAPGMIEQDLARRARERGIPLVLVVTKTDRDGPHDSSITLDGAPGLRVARVSSATGEGIDGLRRLLAEALPPLLGEGTIVGDLLSPGDLVVLVTPIDQAAPRGRLILPQVMTLRDVVDHDAIGLVVKERELRCCLDSLGRKPRLVITDSQAFAKVAADTPRDVPLTSFSILMARQRGSLEDFVAGAQALRALQPGRRVLVAEGCTHHRQGDDIGSVQIPRWLRQIAGGELTFGFCSGADFPEDLASYDLVIHCGACTLTPREVRHRQREARVAGVPMTNYGLTLAFAHGTLERALEPFPAAALAWRQPARAPAASRLKLARTTI